VEFNLIFLTFNKLSDENFNLNNLQLTKFQGSRAFMMKVCFVKHHTMIYIYIYIYICVCVCVCGGGGGVGVCVGSKIDVKKPKNSQVVDAPVLYLCDPVVRYPKGNRSLRMSVSAVLFRSYKDYGLYLTTITNFYTLSSS